LALIGPTSKHWPRAKGLFKTGHIDDLLEYFGLPDWSKGVQSEQLLKFVTHSSVRMTMYGIDLNRDVFVKMGPDDYKLKGQTKNKNLPALIYLLANEHMYPANAEMTKKISEWAKNDRRQTISSAIADSKEKEKKRVKVFERKMHKNMEWSELVELKDCNVVMTETSSLRELYKYLSFEHGIRGEASFSKTSIKEIYLRDREVHIFANKNYEIVLECCAQMKIPFMNQSLGEIATWFVNRFLDKQKEEAKRFGGEDVVGVYGNLKNKPLTSITSELNEITHDIFKKSKKTAFYHV